MLRFEAHFSGCNFNPRSPCGERPRGPVTMQPLPSYFNPRSPCGERRGHHSGGGHDLLISIHALLAESDPGRGWPLVLYTDFNPRSPCGERLPSARPGIGSAPDFNPRSPCGERPAQTAIAGETADFNPRSPCGERLACPLLLPEILEFQSTLSLRRATSKPFYFWAFILISIHALLAESDGIHSPLIPRLNEFQSTLSLRRATSLFSSCASVLCNFNPRSPCGERRCRSPPPGKPVPDFNPRSPCGERR